MTCAGGCGGSCGCSAPAPPRIDSCGAGSEAPGRSGKSCSQRNRATARTFGGEGAADLRITPDPECWAPLHEPKTQAPPAFELLGTARQRQCKPEFVRRVRWTPASGETVLIFPDPIGAIPEGPLGCVVYYENLRQAQAAKGASPRACQRTRARARRSAPRGAGSREEAAADGASSFTVTFEYGEVSFLVPPGTFMMARANGDVPWSSIDDTLDVLWADWRSAIRTNGTSWDNLHAAIGCYNLLVDPNQYLFWNEDNGAPHKVLLHALQMLVVFNEHLDDRESQNACGMGNGFRDMIRNLLTAEPAVRSDGTQVDDFRIHFLSVDSRFMFTSEAGQPCNYSPDGTEFGCGIPFDSWVTDERMGRVGPYIVAIGVDGSGAQIGTSGTDRNGTPWTGCSFGASVPGEADRIRMQPSWLDFCGWLNDYLLYWARVALDYYYETGDLAYFEAAESLARHVLAQILHWAGHIAHEMGHVYCGGGHCCTSGLFQEHARGRFLCAVRAKLGLYLDSVDLSPSSDACNVSDNLAGYSDTAQSAPCCGTVTTDSAGNSTCSSHAQQLCRIGDGVNFLQAASYEDWFFCRTQCTGAPQSAWDATNCAAVEITRTLAEIVVGPDGKLLKQAEWYTCGP